MGEKIKKKLQIGLMISLIGLAITIGIINHTEYSTSIKIFAGILLIVLTLISLMFREIQNMNPSDSHTIGSVWLYYLVTKIMTKMGKSLTIKYGEYCKDISTQQENVLMNILKVNYASAYGKEYKFADVKSVKEFQEIHPVVRSDHYESYFQRVIEGEKNVLSNDKTNDVVRIVTTSGTTGRRKMFPQTKQFSKFDVQIGMFNFYIPILKGCKTNLQKQFFMYTYQKINELKCGLKYGPFTCFVFKYFPYFSYPKAVLDIQIEEVAMYVHGLFLLKEREIGSMVFFMSIQAFNLFKYMEKNWENLCCDIENGTISVIYEEDEATEDAICKLKKYIEPDHDRAARLREEIKLGISGIAHRLWPDLTHCKACSTGSMAVYAKLLREGFLKDIPIVSYFFGGSEGFYGINISPDIDDLCYTPAMPYGFFEFIPVKYINRTQRDIKDNILLTHQVKVGGIYELVVTNLNGLCRYRTGDLVKVSYFTDQCPVYEYLYRDTEVLDLTGERTTAEILYNAIKKVATALHVDIIDYTACEDIYLLDKQDDDVSHKRRYILFLESSRTLLPNEKERFDATLCKESHAYKWLRHTKRTLDPMSVYQVKNRTFWRLEQRMTSEHKNPVQFKMVRTLRNKGHLQFLLDNMIAE